MTMSTCELVGEECTAGCKDGQCAAQDIKELGDGLNDEITFTAEASFDLTQVPKMFRKMALKTIIKGAKGEGVTEIDRDFANKFKP